MKLDKNEKKEIATLIIQCTTLIIQIALLIILIIKFLGK